MAGPIVRISCDKEVEFQKPVTLQVPLSLREKPDFPDSLLVRARVLFQQSEGEHREWTEITESLEFPPSFDETAIRFKVRHFSGYAKAVLLCLLFCAFYSYWMIQLCSCTLLNFIKSMDKFFACYSIDTTRNSIL